MGEDRNRARQSACAATFGDQKPEKHSEDGRPLLGGGPSARAAPFQHELSQALCLPRAGLVAKPSKDLTNVSLVDRERARTCPALLPHPLAEDRKQRGGGGGRGPRRADRAGG